MNSSLKKISLIVGIAICGSVAQTVLADALVSVSQPVAITVRNSTGNIRVVGTDGDQVTASLSGININRKNTVQIGVHWAGLDRLVLEVKYPEVTLSPGSSSDVFRLPDDPKGGVIRHANDAVTLGGLFSFGPGVEFWADPGVVQVHGTAGSANLTVLVPKKMLKHLRAVSNTGDISVENFPAALNHRVLVLDSSGTILLRHVSADRVIIPDGDVRAGESESVCHEVLLNTTPEARELISSIF